MSDPANQFDGPWKEALDLYFRPFLELLFPQIAHDIDWARPLEFLDKEIQKLVPAAETGPGMVDKLVRVWTRRSQQETVFIHVEVQSQADPDLARRMYRYNHRLEDRYKVMPVSLAVLGDDSRHWRPNTHEAGRWGCDVRFTFPVAKLLDWRGKEVLLENQPNVFNPFLVAHLMCLETDEDPAKRLAWKVRIVKRLYTLGLNRTNVLQLYRLIDWMMTLPPPLMAAFAQEIEAFEKEKEMPIITPTEQMWMDKGLEKGRDQGLQEGGRRGVRLGIRSLLGVRFGQPGLDLMPRVEKVPDADTLEAFLKVAETAPDLATLAALLPPA